MFELKEKFEFLVVLERHSFLPVFSGDILIFYHVTGGRRPHEIAPWMRQTIADLALNKEG